MLVQADVAKQLENAQGVHTPVSPAQTEAIVNVVSRATDPVMAQRIAGAKLLWVDDRPENNIYPRCTRVLRCSYDALSNTALLAIHSKAL